MSLVTQVLVTHDLEGSRLLKLVGRMFIVMYRQDLQRTRTRNHHTVSRFAHDQNSDYQQHSIQKDKIRALLYQISIPHNGQEVSQCEEGWSASGGGE